MKDISILEEEYRSKLKADIDKAILEEFIYETLLNDKNFWEEHNMTLNVRTSATHHMMRNGICSLKDFYEADEDAFQNFHSIGPKALTLILHLKKKLSELLEEP